jgi:hypothetical protein
MQAITIDHDGAAPALRSDAPSPTPAAGEVRVRVRASSVNPMDGAIAAGMLNGMVEHEYQSRSAVTSPAWWRPSARASPRSPPATRCFGVVPAMSPTIQAGTWAKLIAVPETNLVRRPEPVDVAVAGVAGWARSPLSQRSTRSPRRPARTCWSSAPRAASGVWPCSCFGSRVRPSSRPRCPRTRPTCASSVSASSSSGTGTSSPPCGSSTRRCRRAHRPCLLRLWRL